MKYLCYVSSNGSLVVRRYLGEHDHQQVRRYIREDIGVIEAPDLETARDKAKSLRTRELTFREKIT